MMPEDLKELLRAFNDQAVKFLIVGGYAFGVHAEPRARLYHAAVIADIAHPGFGIIGDKMAGAGIGRSVEPRS